MNMTVLVLKRDQPSKRRHCHNGITSSSSGNFYILAALGGIFFSSFSFSSANSKHSVDLVHAAYSKIPDFIERSRRSCGKELELEPN